MISLNFRFLILLALFVVDSFGANVVNIDHRNIEEVLQKQPVLIEFFATWCKHCTNFAESYEDVAHKLQAHEFLTGKVDIDASPALAARFNVKSIPQFFLVRDSKVWKIVNRRSIDGLVDYCLVDYLKEPSINMISSPLGPFGRVKGFLSHSGGWVVDYISEWSDSMGVPHIVPYIMIAVAFAISILSCTFIGIYYSVKHVKTD